MFVATSTCKFADLGQKAVALVSSSRSFHMQRTVVPHSQALLRVNSRPDSFAGAAYLTVRSFPLHLVEIQLSRKNMLCLLRKLFTILGGWKAIRHLAEFFVGRHDSYLYHLHSFSVQRYL